MKKAIVLRKLPYGESDLIVHFLLEDGSVISGFASQARKSKRRFPHQFHLAGIYELDSASQSLRDRLVRIQRCELSEFCYALSEDLEAFSRWSVIVEWVLMDVASQFEFAELTKLMRRLTQREQGSLAFYRFFIQQIKIHGLEPQLTQCGICQEALTFEQGDLGFSFMEGGMVHRYCASAPPLSSVGYRQLCSLIAEDEVLSLSGLAELDGILLPYLQSQLGYSLKSFKFLQSLATSL